MTQHAQVDEDFKGTAAMFADRRNKSFKSTYTGRQQAQAEQMKDLVELSCTARCYLNYQARMVTVAIKSRSPAWRSKEHKQAIEGIVADRRYKFNLTISSLIIQMPRSELGR